MKLGDWLKSKNLSDNEFARQLGCEQSTITRLIGRDGKPPQRKPRFDLMTRIAVATNGAVMPNDYMDDLPEIGDEDDDKPPQPSDAACDTDPIRRAS